jgi:Salmonella virulence plasmid 65kDa B protein
MKRTIFTIITAACLALTAMAQNDPVAAIPGKLDVTSLGEATYHIPITVPSGVNGLQPNISLDYNSNAGNGIAGWGFNLNAYSMISRTGRDIVHDGTSKPITWDGNDNFVLDGQRLIMVKQAGTYLTPGTEYRTEIESYRKISMIAANGTTGFQVQAKDGTIYEYGTSDDSQFYIADHSIPITMGIMHWLLHKVTDPNGNYMTYSYGKTQ